MQEASLSWAFEMHDFSMRRRKAGSDKGSVNMHPQIKDPTAIAKI